MANGGLAAVFMATRPALLRYLALRGAATDEAEDILQECFLKVSSGTLGPVAEPRAYLYRLINNQFLAHRRAGGRRVRREEDWVDSQSGERREIDDRPSAEAELIAREQLLILQRAIDSLPERTRAIFRRCRVDGEPQRTVAADTGISVSAVEKHLTRAYETIVSVRLRLDGDRIDPRHLRREGDRDDG